MANFTSIPNSSAENMFTAETHRHGQRSKPFKRCTTKVNEIPEDVLVDILSWLPVKSLLRFKSVCKSWYHLISDDQPFITLHHQRQTVVSNISAIVKYDELYNMNGSYNMKDFYMFSSSLEVTRFADMTIFVRRRISQILSPVKGLICVVHRVDDYPNWFPPRITIWNPSTRQSKALPWSIITNLPPTVNNPVKYGYGFGFDGKTNDYKLLRFSYGNKKKGCIYQVELYSLSNDLWREIPAIDLNTGSSISSGLHNNNGVCYWGITNWDEHVIPLVLSFDFADEVFEKIYLPDQTRSETWNNDIDKFGIVNGLLAVVLGGPTVFDVWVMEEYGGGHTSWAKQWSIDNDTGIFGFSIDGGFFIRHDDFEMVCYDPKTQKMKKLPFVWQRRLLEVVSYVESLVPINVEETTKKSILVALDWDYIRHFRITVDEQCTCFWVA